MLPMASCRPSVGPEKLHLSMEISWNHYHGVTSVQTHFRFSAVISSFHKQPPYKLYSIFTRTSIHVQCPLKQDPQNWMLRSPALVREYLPFYSNLVIRTITISQAYTMKWYVLSSAPTVYDLYPFKSELGHSWLPCGLLDFCHQMAALLCQSL